MILMFWIDSSLGVGGEKEKYRFFDDVFLVWFFGLSCVVFVGR